MNIAAEKYNTINEGQFKCAKILIDKIKSIENEKILDLVVDIGSGSGNVTSLFADNLNYKRLVGLDIDPKMIEFAKKNNQKEEIDFLECDMELPWDKLSEVKQLQGKCSMIYSSLALNWMTYVDVVTDNISKLLASKSRVFIAINDIPSTYLPSEEHRKEFYAIIPLFEGDKFINKWKEAFKVHQFKVDFAETFAVEFTVTTNQLQS